jgi:hypothetical protein
MDEARDKPTLPTQGIDPVKLADIRRLFELMDLKRTQEEAMRSLFDAMAEQVAAVLASDEKSQKYATLVAARLKEKLKRVDLLPHLARVYAKHFSGDEIKGLIALFESPLYRQLETAQPQIVEDTTAVVKGLAEQLAAESVKEILRERPDLAPQTPPATIRPVN